MQQPVEPSLHDDPVVTNTATRAPTSSAVPRTTSLRMLGWLLGRKNDMSKNSTSPTAGLKEWKGVVFAWRCRLFNQRELMDTSGFLARSRSIRRNSDAGDVRRYELASADKSSRAEPEVGNHLRE